MPSPQRSKIVDLKKAATKREDARWAASVPSSSQSRGSKPERLRSRRRKKRALVLSVCMLLGAGAVGGLGFLSHAERFAINTIAVEGTEQLSANALIAAVESGLADNVWKIFAKRNMFLYPAGEIEEKLSLEFPRIKDVQLSRASLVAQAVTVSVVERAAHATWCDPAGACFFLDDGGFIFAESSSSQTPMHAYVFHGGLLPHTSIIGQTFLRGRLGGTTHLLELLKNAGYEAKSLTVENEKDFSVKLSSGLTLFIPFIVEPSDVVRDLKIALEADSVRDRVEELEYVDLRFGNRVYYKFKGELIQGNGDL